MDRQLLHREGDECARAQYLAKTVREVTETGSLLTHTVRWVHRRCRVYDKRVASGAVP